MGVYNSGGKAESAGLRGKVGTALPKVLRRYGSAPIFANFRPAVVKHNSSVSRRPSQPDLAYGSAGLRG
jgi:hypothetical protein